MLGHRSDGLRPVSLDSAIQHTPVVEFLTSTEARPSFLAILFQCCNDKCSIARACEAKKVLEEYLASYIELRSEQGLWLVKRAKDG